MNYPLVRRALLLIIIVSMTCQAQTSSVLASVQSGHDDPGCDRIGALALVQQQLSEVKGLNDTVARIKILIRAADLLWTSQPEAARNAFTEAYELASQNIQEQGNDPPSVKVSGPIIVVIKSDQRFVVINAIARRDGEWAKRLAERASSETQAAKEESLTAGRRDTSGIKLGENFLYLASSMMSTNKQAALDFARSSFRYPPSWDGLPHFLYNLAGVDQQTADQFYLEALNFYATKPISQLLYLSSYPFALNRFVGPEASLAYSSAPNGFAPSSVAQKRFLEVLLGRAQKSVQPQSQSRAPGDSDTMPEIAQIYLALSSLEPVIEHYQPEMAERAAEMKTTLSTMMSGDLRQEADRMNQEQREIDQQTFSSFADKIEHETVSWKKDFLIAQAVMAGVKTESLERLEDFAQKVEESRVHEQLLNWLYFISAQKAAHDGLLEDAARLARKVDQVDQRAYLFFEIAKVAEKKFGDKGRVREALDEAAKIALTAPNTQERARALLGVANLYAKLDQFRALEVMGDAVKTINRIEKPDFTLSAVFQQIQGEKFAIFASYPVSGFNLENAFRDLAAVDFQGALALARNFDSKHLRATTIIAIAAQCLEKPGEKKGKGEKRNKA
jgi:hypothetical protein